MTRNHIKLVYLRELRDQLRDKRTLFMVLVLPMLLYPLLGMALLQVSQFMNEEPVNVWLVGQEQFSGADSPIEGDRFRDDLVDEGRSWMLNLVSVNNGSGKLDLLLQELQQLTANDQGLSRELKRQIQFELSSRQIDLLVIFPTGLSEAIRSSAESQSSDVAPQVAIFQNSARAKSQVAGDLVGRTLNRWQARIAANNLHDLEVPSSAIRPFELVSQDIATKTLKRAVMWAKILPFVIVIWALTGAFYPAVDLCAGEKERGTLETLLSSPARRSHIVTGKLLTVMTFSMLTSILNLASMGFTGMFVVGRMTQFGSAGMPVGLPPVAVWVWLLMALIPISALFSSLAMAIAAFARSSKEGQYYLMPLLMITLPLMMLPMLPSAELDFGTSLIPVTGLMLLLRSLIEGQYGMVFAYAGPVCAVTIVCCGMAMRWAVRQFDKESVLFRSSERYGLGALCRHVFNHRGDMPTIGQAIMCGVVILVIKFFVGFAMPVPMGWVGFCKQTIITLVATVAVPAILMAIVLTRRPRLSLRIQLPKWWAVPLAISLAVLLHPAFMLLSQWVLQVYPPSENVGQIQALMARILGEAPGLWAVIGVMAVAPAICEEIAFRGFILSGLQSLRSRSSAIFICSLLFGAAHSVIQQSIVTFVVGIVIGIIAVQTRSLLPCIGYHAVHNALAVVMSQIDPALIANSTWLGYVFQVNAQGAIDYQMATRVVFTVAGGGLLFWLCRFKVERLVSAFPAASTSGLTSAK